MTGSSPSTPRCPGEAEPLLPDGAPPPLEVPGLLLVGAGGREVGKTELVCRILRRFTPDTPVAAVKVATLHNGPCPRGAEGCGVCGSLGDRPYLLDRETEPGGGKDTQRLLAAGGAPVLWLRVRPEHLAEGLAALLSCLPPGRPLICESTSLRRVARPDLFLLVHTRAGATPKPSALAVADRVDRWIRPGPDGLDLDPAELALRDGRWRL